MNSYTKQIETCLDGFLEQTILEASDIYKSAFTDIPKTFYYVRNSFIRISSVYYSSYY